MKKIVISAIIVIILTVIIFGTSAYYADSIASGRNTVVSGNLSVSVIEERIDPETGDRVVYDGPVPVVPGVAVSKIVSVRNNGAMPAYIRISVDKSFVLAQGQTGNVNTDLIFWELNSEFWTERDGYYYYSKPLAAGAQTEPLFTSVEFSANMDDLYEKSHAVVSINMQAVQSVNNGTTVFEAEGWPSDEEEGGNA